MKELKKIRAGEKKSDRAGIELLREKQGLLMLHRTRLRPRQTVAIIPEGRRRTDRQSPRSQLTPHHAGWADLPGAIQSREARTGGFRRGWGTKDPAVIALWPASKEAMRWRPPTSGRSGLMERSLNRNVTMQACRSKVGSLCLSS